MYRASESRSASDVSALPVHASSTMVELPANGRTVRPVEGTYVLGWSEFDGIRYLHTEKQMLQ